MTVLIVTSGVTRNSGAPGQNIERGPHESWAMSLIPCYMDQTGYFVSVYTRLSALEQF